MSNSESLSLNLNADETARRLFDALYALMQTRTIEELSVGDILDKAQVSRSSFYRRYMDKYDLLTKSYGLLLENTLMKSLAGASWEQMSRELYSIIMRHPSFFAHAFAHNGQNSLRQYICDTVLTYMRGRLAQGGVDLDADWHLSVMAQAFVQGTMEATCRWAREGMPYPAQELITLLNSMMPEPLRRYCLGEKGENGENGGV